MILFIGTIAGWIAGQIIRGQGFSIAINIFLGITGAIVGNFILLSLLGFAAYDMIGQLIASIIGVVTILLVSRLISPGNAKS